MKVVWKASDIITGRRVQLPFSSEEWLLGYIPNGPTNTYVCISCSDGLVITHRTKEDLAVYLTFNEYMPTEILK